MRTISDNFCKKKEVTEVSGMWMCANCGNENQSNYCTNCGTAKPMQVNAGGSLCPGFNYIYPNMFNFLLPNKQEEAPDRLCGSGLPSYVWWFGFFG